MKKFLFTLIIIFSVNSLFSQVQNIVALHVGRIFKEDNSLEVLKAAQSDRNASPIKDEYLKVTYNNLGQVIREEEAIIRRGDTVFKFNGIIFYNKSEEAFVIKKKFVEQERELVRKAMQDSIKAEQKNAELQLKAYKEKTKADQELLDAQAKAKKKRDKTIADAEKSPEQREQENAVKQQILIGVFNTGVAIATKGQSQGIGGNGSWGGDGVIRTRGLGN